MVAGNTIVQNQRYGVLLDNSAGNVGVIRTGKNANKLTGNTIADFRAVFDKWGAVLRRVGIPRKTPRQPRPGPPGVSVMDTAGRLVAASPSIGH